MKNITIDWGETSIQKPLNKRNVTDALSYLKGHIDEYLDLKSRVLSLLEQDRIVSMTLEKNTKVNSSPFIVNVYYGTLYGTGGTLRTISENLPN